MQAESAGALFALLAVAVQTQFAAVWVGKGGFSLHYWEALFILRRWHALGYGYGHG